MPYATADDVIRRWIASTLPPDKETITGYLEDATVLIDAEFPDLAARAAANPVIAARAAVVARRMVMRVLTNPDQLRSTSETTGPFSGGVTYATETLTGVSLPDGDRAPLSAVPPRTQIAFSTAPPPAARAAGPVLYTSQIANTPESP